MNEASNVTAMDFAPSQLLIIQWLGPGEARTGLALKERLEQEKRRVEVRRRCFEKDALIGGQRGLRPELVDLIECDSLDSFRSALSKFLARAAEGKVSAIHIDCHGAVADINTPQEICIGLSGHDATKHRGTAEMSWRELDEYLVQFGSQSVQPKLVMLSGCRTDDIHKYWKTRTPSGVGESLLGAYDVKFHDEFLLQSAATFYEALFFSKLDVFECSSLANVYNQSIEDPAKRGFLTIDRLRF